MAVKKIYLPKPQVDAGEDRTNSMHFPHFFSSSWTITGKHSGCVTFLPTDPQHEIALPLCPVNREVFVNKIMNYAIHAHKLSSISRSISQNREYRIHFFKSNDYFNNRHRKTVNLLLVSFCF